MTAEPTTTSAARRQRFMLLAVFLAALAAGAYYWMNRPQAAEGDCSSKPPVRTEPEVSGPPWFRDVTEGSGLQFTYRNGQEANQFALLEVMGGGVALLDYD